MDNKAIRRRHTTLFLFDGRINWQLDNKMAAK